MTLRIQRAAERDVVIFSLSGRIEGERVAELQSLFASEAADRRILLNMREVDLVDQEAVRFLARCLAEGIRLEQCPAYIREWIVRESV